MDALSRCFLGIRVPVTFHPALSQFIMEFRKKAPGDPIRWVDVAGLHITLAFLGELRPEQVRSVREVARGICARSNPMTLQISGVGGFPNPVQPRIVWAGVAGDIAPLIALQKELEQACRPFSAHTESKEYAPHITLGRLKMETEAARTNAGRAVKMSQLQLDPWLATEVELLQSSGAGPVGVAYNTIERFPLSERSAG